MSVKKTHRQYTQQCRKVHGRKYRHLSRYEGHRKKMLFKCNDENHPAFWQRADAHLAGSGCKLCYWESMRK